MNKTRYICRRCGYGWMARVKNPKACPNCKQYLIKFKKEAENEVPTGSG